MTTLPRLGLGISSNADAHHSPHPYRIARALFDYIEYSAPIDFDEALSKTTLFADMIRQPIPLLFHPVELNLYGPELEDEAKLARLSAHAKHVGSPWVSNDVAWWHQGGQLWPGYQYIAPPFTRRGLADCTAHALHVQRCIEVPLLLENPAVIAKRGDLHVLDFMAELHARTGCMLLLDLGHLLSYQLTAGLPKESGLDAFPLHAVGEIHIAGGMIASRGDRTVYFDAHAEPIHQELFDLLEAVAPRCPQLAAITYECDGHTEAMTEANLGRLRRFEISHERVKPSDEAWSIAQAAYAGDDEVEGEYRRAIAAEAIDPFGGERVSGFVRSNDFLGAFRENEPLLRRYARWLRRA